MPGSDITIDASFERIESDEPTDPVTGCDKDEECPLHSFTDIKKDDPYHDALHYCVIYGIIHGYPDGTLLPEGNITRAEVIAILWRLDGAKKTDLVTSFEDARGDWYTDAVSWAESIGIAKGHEDGRFDPHGSVTREQLSAFFYRYEVYSNGVPTLDGSVLSSFADGSDHNEYAYESLAWATKNGIIRGRSNGLIDAKGTATRAEAAQMIYNYVK